MIRPLVGRLVSVGHCHPRAIREHLLQLIRFWVCASGILASNFKGFPANMGLVEPPIQLILSIQTASVSKQRGHGPRMACQMVITSRILKHQNPIWSN